MKVIELPWPPKELHSNARVNWNVKHRATAKARRWACLAALEAPRVECIPDAQIFVEYYPKTRRGDVHNVASSLKAYIDGIADAMGCDDKKFCVDYPRQWAGTHPDGKVIFRVHAPVRAVPVRGAIS